MALLLTEQDRNGLETAAAAERRVRRWRRYQAVLLLATGQSPGSVAQSLDCSRASVYAWVAAWRRTGIAGLQEGAHGGWRKLDAAGGEVPPALLGPGPPKQGPQAAGWAGAL